MTMTMDPARSAERSNDFGGRMKRLREARGVGLREIAETTKISVSALEALERNDISRLPGGIFSRGFVRAYAEQIGADPETTVREFIERFPDDSAGGAFAGGDEINTDPPSQLARQIVIALVVIVPIAVFALWAMLLRN